MGRLCGCVTPSVLRLVLSTSYCVANGVRTLYISGVNGAAVSVWLLLFRYLPHAPANFSVTMGNFVIAYFTQQICLKLNFVSQQDAIIEVIHIMSKVIRLLIY